MKKATKKQVQEALDVLYASAMVEKGTGIRRQLDDLRNFVTAIITDAERIANVETT